MTGRGCQGNLIGRHRSTGIARPHFWERARYYGEEKRLAAALDAAEITARRSGLGAGRSMKTQARSAFLATVSIGGVAWAFLLPYLSGEKADG